MRLIWTLALVLTPSLGTVEAAEPAPPLGKKIDAFQLRDFRGAERSLKEFSECKLVAIAFLGVECPLAKLYGPRLVELAREYEPKGVAFLAINANQQDSVTAIGQYVKTAGIAFPVLKDVGNVVADRFGAERTPEVFVLDGERAIRYRGRIDDQYGVGYVRPKPSRRDLALALDELLAGKAVSQPVTEVPGCFIGRVKHEPKKGELTYSKHIAPILRNRCVECHRTGQIAPFALTTYDEVIGWTDTIEEVIREERMPPWHASPKYGKFANDRHLPEAEKQLIFQWIKEGAPQGDAKDLPKPVEFAEGWRIPKPDLVIPLPKAFRVPARGDVEYQFFVVDPGFKEDKWVKASEVRPGCRSVVHHVLVFAQPPGGSDPDRGGLAAHFVAATVPGAQPLTLPDGMAKRIPAGSRLLFQIHYTPNGSEQLDRTEMGLVFADPKTVKQEVVAEMAVEGRFAIPPQDPNYKVESTYRVREDSILLEMMPHTHLRGKTFQYEAIYPNGEKEILLDLPKYDFNWQNTYTLAQPKRLPKGTRIHCTAHYDNSKNNPSNPDPKATVRWGDQTWEEMMIGYFHIMAADQDLQKNPLPVAKTASPEMPPLDPELRDLARHALESDKTFDKFAAAVRKTAPKVDRVCVTLVANGSLRVKRASYPGQVLLKAAMAGYETHSKMVALAFYALFDRFTYLPDLGNAQGLDMALMSKTLSSSVHVPIARDGEPGTVNFWSKEKVAFPKETQDLFRALAEAIAERS